MKNLLIISFFAMLALLVTSCGEKAKTAKPVSKAPVTTKAANACAPVAKNACAPEAKNACAPAANACAPVAAEVPEATNACAPATEVAPEATNACAPAAANPCAPQ